MHVRNGVFSSREKIVMQATFSHGRRQRGEQQDLVRRERNQFRISVCYDMFLYFFFQFWHPFLLVFYRVTRIYIAREERVKQTAGKKIVLQAALHLFFYMRLQGDGTAEAEL